MIRDIFVASECAFLFECYNPRLYSNINLPSYQQRIPERPDALRKIAACD